jgi:hypothetical protein
VGHVATSGGGARNQFGKDFDEAEKAWTVSFCITDSDGDGQSNGQELGDPCCVWTTSKSPNATTDISDPSIASSKTSRPACPYTVTAASSASLHWLTMAVVAAAMIVTLLF